MSHVHDPNNNDYSHILGLLHRKLTDEQQVRFEGYIAEIFSALGLDLNSESARETPSRYLKAMLDITSGYDGDPKLVKAFETECRGGSDCRLSQVIEGPISFFSLCEHHALPFFGYAYIGYIPHEHIFGLSKLSRLVHLFAARFAVQERIGKQIADAMVTILQPHGVAVYLEAHHLCIEMRGVREKTPTTRTTFWRGFYEDDPALRAEFLNSCGIHK
ncbi:GTP cyclohydrolase I [Geobacter sp. DSM 9736]|uniref:GTP cyclohydrolase I n=1 Tax=Geobacter sp. DSM 9736 TaxID=1277350 RepID=UPI000B5025FC|nr:GTP cyclohydrolase I [Geobacter sp. DSM 9736]SNB47774.1 GTP cyclohydrolase I [Geobacter sp. DSM 9736]